MTRPRIKSWLVAFATIALALIVSKSVLPGDGFPADWKIHLGEGIASAADWFVENCEWFYGPFGEAVNAAFEWTLQLLRIIPAPILCALTVVSVFCLGGTLLAILCAVTITWIVSVGLWNEAKETVTLMIIAVIMASVCGIGIGLLSSFNDRVRAVTNAVLDGMQTIPVFVYLLPVVLAFGPGNTSALIVTMIYSLPPIAKLTDLGIRRVDPAVVEAARSLGVTRLQLLKDVQLPLARPTIMAGLNQTIMLAIAMSIIAAMIGAAGLGEPVWNNLGRLELGRALDGGIALVLIAILVDRVTSSYAERSARPRSLTSSGGFSLQQWASRNPQRAGSIMLLLAFSVVVLAVPALRNENFAKPGQLIDFSMRGRIEPAIDWLNIQGAFIIDPLRDGIVLYGINPLTAAIGWIPWPVSMLVTLLAGWYLLGLGKGMFLAIGVLCIGLLGMWDEAVITIALVGTAVALAIAIGIPTGIAMSFSDRGERTMRPILDIMQTMPIFLFVIPAVIVFGTGEVPGIIATVLYAIPPVIRLTNVALREVAPQVVEASASLGATWAQTLLSVRIPMGMPLIINGINQTIMLALAMSVVSAFIGAPGLGSTILVALAQIDLASGSEAGLAMLILALISGQILSGIVERVRQAEHLSKK